MPPRIEKGQGARLINQKPDTETDKNDRQADRQRQTDRQKTENDREAAHKDCFSMSGEIMTSAEKNREEQK